MKNTEEAASVKSNRYNYQFILTIRTNERMRNTNTLHIFKIFVPEPSYYNIEDHKL